MYNYYGKLIKVVDGDTIDVEVDLGFHTCVKERLRLADIDTPEVYGKNASPEGTVAKNYVINALTDKLLRIETFKDRTGKYGRFLALVYYQSDNRWINLNDELIEKGLAKPYEW
ncbi:MAG TPA: thermonuclease family protein [Thermodesulfobacteriota bacterium]|nr:thermonuclease family protein [Thermodesulfobacteriota bacterium]